jgi:hypothetical protein
MVTDYAAGGAAEDTPTLRLASIKESYASGGSAA